VAWLQAELHRVALIIDQGRQRSTQNSTFQCMLLVSYLYQIHLLARLLNEGDGRVIFDYLLKQQRKLRQRLLAIVVKSCPIDLAQVHQ
jgi:CRISPR/Cas system-associated endoribonuclease Cas2